jgi:AraC-like DNA-binding protein
MQPIPLNHLLFNLDVAVEAIALCEVRRGLHLVGQPETALGVHYVLAGTMYLTAGSTLPVVCGPGSVVIVPPNVAQKIAADRKPGREVLARENCSLARDGLLVVDAAGGRQGDLRIVCGLVTPTGASSFDIFDDLKAPVAASLGDAAFFKHAYAMMLEEAASPGLGSRALLGALMKSCLMPVLRRHFSCPENRSALLAPLRDPRLGKALAAIAAAPAQTHTVASLAATACMSRSAFAKEFSSRFGMTPMEFVVKTRLRHASELLRATGLPVKQVAASVGFSSRSHFSRAFRECYGADPSSFRAKMHKSVLGD